MSFDVASEPPKLELIGLRKEYDDGAVVAVDGVDLQVAAGETLALLGPSGCGKSTTLNMIVGLERPTMGDIRVDGVSIVDQPAGQRPIGLVFQDYAVFTHMTVAKNLAFGLEVRGTAKAEVTRRVAETAELLGLTKVLRESADRLGGSELQRVAIGRTLVTQPAVLLLDEPLSNLEAEMRMTMRRELRRLQAEIGLTIIYVTHDQIEALSLARRIAVMSNGKIRQCDATATVYERPAHTFVAGFMGSPPMNLIKGRLQGSAAVGQEAQFVAQDFAVSAPPLATAPAGPEVLLGLRPDAIKLTRHGEGLPATVRSVEPRGAEAVLEVESGGVRLTVVTPAEGRPEEGATVGLAFAAERLVVFCGETHRNISDAMAPDAAPAVLGASEPVL